MVSVVKVLQQYVTHVLLFPTQIGCQTNIYPPLYSLMSSLGFQHRAKGVVDSIVNGKELEDFIKKDAK